MPYLHDMQRLTCTMCNAYLHDAYCLTCMMCNALLVWCVMLCLYVCGHAFCIERVTSALSAELLTRNKTLCLWACVCNERVTSVLLTELRTRNMALCLWAWVCNERVTSALSAELLTRNKALCLWAWVCNERVTSALSAELLTRNNALCLCNTVCVVLSEIDQLQHTGLYCLLLLAPSIAHDRPGTSSFWSGLAMSSLWRQFPHMDLWWCDVIYLKWSH